MQDHDDSFGSSPHHSLPEGESIVERAVRESFKEKELQSDGSPLEFTEEDHFAIAKSGSADLSEKEARSLLQNLELRTEEELPQSPKGGTPIPLFFGSWSGMNPFRFIKPFYLSK